MSSSKDSKRAESGREVLRRSLHEMMNSRESNPEGHHLNLPSDGIDTELAAKWLRDPALMLKQLKDSLVGYCSTYFDFEHSEAEIDSRRNVTPERSVFSLEAISKPLQA